LVDLAEIQAAYYMVAATGVLVAAGYYVLNMRAMQRSSKQTLDTRQAQLLMNLYQRWSDYRRSLRSQAKDHAMKGGLRCNFKIENAYRNLLRSIRSLKV
jgi:Flp pilus assembly protein TadB